MIRARSVAASLWLAFTPRWAWLHFAVLGALLFGAHHAWLRAAPSHAGVAAAVDWDWAPASEPELLYREALRRGLDIGDSVVRRRLVQNMRFLASASEGAGEGDDELFYREALALGLDRSDRVVRRRLVELMRQILIEERDVGWPDDAALREHLRLNEERFRRAARRRIEQLYFTTAERARDARSGFVKAGPAAAAVAVYADPLPIPRKLPALSQRELAARFGEAFAREAFALPVGDWSAPIASSYGEHLVRVHEVVSDRRSTLAEVRRGLTAHWVASREEQALAVAIIKLRGADVPGAPRQLADSREVARPGELR